MSAHLSIALVSDCHGCYHTLTRLLNAIPKPFKLILLGDLIDRGPHSRQVVEFAMQNGIPTVLGNHESLCLAFYNHDGRCNDMYDRGVWLDNGGDKAVRGWPTIDKRTLTGPQIAQAEHIGGRVPDAVLDWMEALPAYILGPADQLDANGRRGLFSHTGYGLDADKGDWFRALWGRHPHGDGDFPDDGYWRTVGHSSVKVPQITDTYGYIDTGAAYGQRGFGVMTALMWPSKEVFTQPFDETVVTPRFQVANGVIT